MYHLVARVKQLCSAEQCTYQLEPQPLISAQPSQVTLCTHMQTTRILLSQPQIITYILYRGMGKRKQCLLLAISAIECVETIKALSVTCSLSF